MVLSLDMLMSDETPWMKAYHVGVEKKKAVNSDGSGHFSSMLNIGPLVSLSSQLPVGVKLEVMATPLPRTV